ncbi:MAG: hypothetical protein JSW52_08840 [Candidatus Coatesbacteria bacterium]|nr:MAG: hypothetical protein JSW52_08840 [Candidatus Coatesbacteria bacterium]
MADGPPRKDKVFAALCYAGPLCVIIYLYAKSDFVKTHGKQALSVFVVQVIGLVVADLFRPLIGPRVYVVWAVWFVLTAVLQVALAARALTGKAGVLKYLPE